MLYLVSLHATNDINCFDVFCLWLSDVILNLLISECHKSCGTGCEGPNTVDCHDCEKGYDEQEEGCLGRLALLVYFLDFVKKGAACKLF